MEGVVVVVAVGLGWVELRGCSLQTSCLRRRTLWAGDPQGTAGPWLLLPPS